MALFQYTWRTFGRELVLVLSAAVIFIPIYFLLTLSLKTPQDVFLDPMSFPAPPHLANYGEVWRGSAGVTFGRAVFNSVVITLGSVLGLIALGSLCAYTLVRRPSKLSTATYYLFVLAIILPFQLAIVPLYVAMRRVDLVPSFAGYIVVMIGLFMPLTVFLYTGFVRALPLEYEEAARVDGASKSRTFIRVVFPLLRPVTATVAVLTSVLSWNEFFVPLIFLSGSEYQTLPVIIYSFVGEYVTRYNFIYAAVVVAVLPVIFFFLFAQRQLIQGFSGGVRG